MTDLTEREKQIVAWLRDLANGIDIGGPFYSKSGPYWIIADAIERGEPWKELDND